MLSLLKPVLPSVGGFAISSDGYFISPHNYSHNISRGSLTFKVLGFKVKADTVAIFRKKLFHYSPALKKRGYTCFGPSVSGSVLIKTARK